MGALGDWFDKYQRAAVQGASLGGTAPAAPGAPTMPGGTSGSYVPQSNGGVQGGGRSALDVLAGQNTTHVDPALQASLPDAGDQAAAQAATQEAQQKYDAWKQEYDSLVPKALVSQDARDRMKVLLANKPQQPDLLAIQNQSDRNRLLNEGSSAYAPLISELGSAAQGNGPSQALAQYRIAADEAQRRALGVAASANGTGGQRAALMQSAIAQAAQGQQQAAAQAAAIGATEQQNARSSLSQALTGLTNVYGTQLYGGTQNQQTANQNANNNAIALNENIQQSNAKNATDLAKAGLDTGAKVTGSL